MTQAEPASHQHPPVRSKLTPRAAMFGILRGEGFDLSRFRLNDKAGEIGRLIGNAHALVRRQCGAGFYDAVANIGRDGQ